MPGKGGGAARRKRTPSFRRPDAGSVAVVALGILRRRRGTPPTQAELAREVRPRLREEEPLAALGGRRLRRILLGTDGVRVDVTYAERGHGPIPASCPVCGAPLAAIANQTLEGTRVALGARCASCGYWTHQRLRVPVRYAFRAVGRPRKATLAGSSGRRSA